MAILTASDILTRARDRLQDLTGVRWADTELKRYLLDAQILISWISPGSGPTSVVTLLLAAGIYQSVTDSGGRTVSRVMDVLWNQSGSTIGNAVRKLSKDQLDAQRPTWPAAAQASEIEYWMPFEDEPTAFLVSPPAVANTGVRVKLALVPNSADTIEVADACREAVLAWVVHSALAKDATYATASAQYYDNFTRVMGAVVGGNKEAMARLQQRTPPR